MGRSRERLTGALQAAQFTVLPSEGTYFLIVDLAASGIAMGDLEFCQRAVREHGVAAIPLSALYAQDPPGHLIRLCFAKTDATLDEGARRLAAARTALG
jgi:N-succinyldiaminopimelate aminotransferase